LAVRGRGMDVRGRGGRVAYGGCELGFCGVAGVGLVVFGKYFRVVVVVVVVVAAGRGGCGILVFADYYYSVRGI
jgi:hypothetical protein